MEVQASSMMALLICLSYSGEKKKKKENWKTVAKNKCHENGRASMLCAFQTALLPRRQTDPLTCWKGGDI